MRYISADNKEAIRVAFMRGASISELVDLFSLNVEMIEGILRDAFLFVTCIYCGQEYPLSEHIHRCVKHLFAEYEKQLDELITMNRKLIEEIEQLMELKEQP